jgi:putative NADH-flavin reductase
MRLFILGANGRTGRELVDLALARGHHVTAFVRSPHKIAARHERLAIVAGDPLATAELARALPGHDAVISALGVRARQAFKPHALLENAAASTVAAMTEAGVARLLFVSAATLFPEKGLFFAFFRWLLEHQIADTTAAEGIIASTSLDWTLARPPRLTEGGSDAMRIVVDALPPGGRSLSYRALARYLIDAVEQHAHVRRVVGLAR